MNEEPNQETNPTTNEEPTNQPDKPTPEVEESTDQPDTEDLNDAGDDADDDTTGSNAPSNQASAVSPQAPSPAADDDEDYGKQILPDNQELPVFDPSKLPVGEDGLIDVNAIGAQLNETMQKRDEALMARIQRQQHAVDTERSGWNDVFEKHEEVKTDGELRDDIQAYRMGHYQMTGKLMSPQKAAERYFKRFGAAREQGIEQASKNTKVQNSAYNDAGSRRVSSEEQRQAKLNEQMRSSDPEVRKKASHEMLKGALFGK
jgi:hypothetical protein